MQLSKISIHIEGVSPLIQNSIDKANPFHPATKALKALTSKRKKSEEDLEEIMRREWEAGMYRDAAGPYVPSLWVESMIRDGAKKNKNGKKVTAALLTEVDRFYVEYDGPKGLEEMWADGRFLDYRAVTVQRAKTMRARPKFDAWALTFDVLVNANELDPAEVQQALDNAGMLVGLGDYRPKFGRFVVRQFDVQEAAA